MIKSTEWALVSLFGAATFFTMMASNSSGAVGDAPALLPLPVRMEIQPGVFRLKSKTRVLSDAASSETAQYLADRLWPATGYQLRLGASSASAKGNILLTTRDAKSSLGEEGYELIVTKDSVTIRAPSQAGLFYGVQTLLQLLPPQIYAATAASGVHWTVPCVQIEDQPRFKWRGLMLDVSAISSPRNRSSRFSTPWRPQKLNTFHWHLVDDPGWRIEIKRYPLPDGGGRMAQGHRLRTGPESEHHLRARRRYGGYYTQADIREVVAYAPRAAHHHRAGD